MKKLLAAFMLFCAGAAYAEVTIARQDKKSLTLKPGGAIQKVRFHGSNFDEIRWIQVLKDDKRRRDFVANWKPVSQGIGELELQAPANAAPGEYKLQYIFKRGSQKVPLEVKVEP